MSARSAQARPATQLVRHLVRASQRSRLEPQCWSSAYEQALPIVRRTLAEPNSAKPASAKPEPRSRSFTA